MQEGFQSDQETAASITKAASKQTYYTIRFLVDRQKVPDAYRAYAYVARFEVILDAIERMDYRLALEYPWGKGFGSGMRMRGSVLSLAFFSSVRR